MNRKEESVPVSLASERQRCISNNVLAVAEDIAAGVAGVSSVVAYSNALFDGITNGVHAETWGSVGVGGATAMACGILVLHHFDRKF